MYAYPWLRETEVKTELNHDRGGPRPDQHRDRDLDRMVCQKPDHDRDRPTLTGIECRHRDRVRRPPSSVGFSELDQID